MTEGANVPEFVYASSREEAQRLLDSSYLQKYAAVPMSMKDSVFTLGDAFRLIADMKDAEHKRHRKWVARAWRYRSAA